MLPTVKTRHSSTINHKPLLHRLKCLLASLPGSSSNNHFRSQHPCVRDIPLLGNLVVNDRVVMLQVCAQAFGFERAPQCVLMHGGGLLRPFGELGGVGWEAGLHGFYGIRVVEEENLLGGNVSVFILINVWIGAVIGRARGIEGGRQNSHFRIQL
jgi:hypothetical protein